MANFIGQTDSNDKEYGNSLFSLTTYDQDNEIELKSVLTELPELNITASFANGPMSEWQSKLNDFLNSDIMNMFQTIGSSQDTNVINQTIGSWWTRRMYSGYSISDINLKFRIYKNNSYGFNQIPVEFFIKYLSKYATISTNSVFNADNSLRVIYSAIKNSASAGGQFVDTLSNVFIPQKQSEESIQRNVKINKQREEMWNDIIPAIRKILNSINGHPLPVNAQIENKKDELLSNIAQFSFGVEVGTHTNSGDFIMDTLMEANGMSNMNSGNTTLAFKSKRPLMIKNSPLPGSADPFEKSLACKVMNVIQKIQGIDMNNMNNITVYSENKGYENAVSDYNEDAIVSMVRNLLTSQLSSDANKKMNNTQFDDNADAAKKAIDEYVSLFKQELTRNVTIPLYYNKYRTVDDSFTRKVGAMTNFVSGIADESEKFFTDKFSEGRVEYNYNRKNQLGSKLWYLRLYRNVFFQMPLTVFITNWTVTPSKYAQFNYLNNNGDDDKINAQSIYYDFSITCKLDQVLSLDTWFKTITSLVSNPAVADRLMFAETIKLDN